MFYEGRKSLTENERNLNSKINFKEYFKIYKHRFLDQKCLFYCCDAYYNLSYILTDPLLIIQTDSQKIVEKIKINEKIKLDRDSKILSFYYDQKLFLLIIDKQSLFIYSLSSSMGNFTNCKEEPLTKLKENEEIFKISLINNEPNSTFFIYTTTLCRVFFMRITPRITTYNQEYEYNLAEEELKEKSNLFKSLLNFVKPNRTIENSFILNPNPKRFFKSCLDLNKVYVLTDTTIQRIDFSVSNFKISHEITYPTPLSNILIDNLKLHLKTSINLTTKNYCIEAADIHYDSLKKVCKIYCVLRLLLENKFYFYFYHFDITGNNEIQHVNISYIEGAELNSIYRIGLFSNKAKNEGFYIFSNKNFTNVTYFSDHDKSKKPIMITHNMKFEINGLSNLHFKDFLEIYLFSFNEGLFNIFLKDEHLFDSNKTEDLVSNLTERVEDSMISFNVSYKKHSSVDNSALNEENRIYQLFNEALFNYSNKKLSVIDLEKLKLLLNEMKIEFKMNILEKTILAKLDDETENIDFSNRESKNADLSILDYLKEKEMNLLQVQIFCDYIDFFGHLDDKNKLFYTFLMYLEKLTISIEMRKIENGLIQESEYLNFKKIFHILKEDIFEEAFNEIKKDYKSNLRSKSFVKRSLYSNISKIEKYLIEIHKAYKKYIDQLNVGKEEKLRVTLFLIYFWNILFQSIKEIHNKFADKLNHLKNNASYNQNYLWLINPSFISNLQDLSEKFFMNNENKFDDNDSSYILNFTDNLLYLNEKYYSFNYFNEGYKMMWEELKTKTIRKIVKINHEFSLRLSEKYADFYNITKICYDYRLIDRLKENMTKIKSFARYALRQYLIFEIKSNSKTIFSFFENFSEFTAEMLEVTNRFPKIAFLHKLFLNHYDNQNFTPYFYFAKNDDIQSKINYQNVCKLMNCISDKNMTINKAYLMDQDNMNIDEIHYQSNFYMLLNYLKLKFKISEQEYDFCKIVNHLLKLEVDNFDEVISKKYILIVQLFILAKTNPPCTLSGDLNEHYEKINVSYKELIKHAVEDDIINCQKLLDNFKMNFNLNNLNDFSDDQKKFFIKNSILDILKEKLGIDLILAKDYVKSDEIKNKIGKGELLHVNQDMLNQYFEIFSCF